MEMRRLSRLMILMTSFAGSIFILISAPVPYFGIADLVFFVAALFSTIFSEKVYWIEPRAYAWMALSLCTTSFFVSYFYDIGIVGIAGLLTSYATVPLIILYYHTFNEYYFFRKREVVSCSIGLVIIIILSIANFFNGVAMHSVYLIPAFFGYLFMIVADGFKKPSKYFKIIHLGVVLLHLTIFTTLLVSFLHHVPLATGSLLLIGISSYNVIKREY